MLLLVVERIPFSMCWCFSVCETLRGFGLGILVLLWVGPPCFWCFSVAGLLSRCFRRGEAVASGDTSGSIMAAIFARLRLPLWNFGVLVLLVCLIVDLLTAPLVVFLRS